MDIVKTAKNKFADILSRIDGLKSLIMDDDTMIMINMICGKKELTDKEIFLFEEISKLSSNKYQHVSAIFFVKPTKENTDKITAELQKPRYSQYHLLFTHKVADERLRKMAYADDYQRVVNVSEIHINYYLTSPYSFHFSMDKYNQENATLCLASFLTSNNIKASIRYQKNSPVASKLALSINKIHNQNETTDTLLIIDRNEDFVTPLLAPWLYQSMIHEYLGIKGNTVILPELKDKQKVKLTDDDEFFLKNKHGDYGKLCDELAISMKKYQVDIDASKKVTEMKDMKDIKKLIYDIPKLNKTYSELTQHFAITDKFNKVIKDRDLYTLSELQQNIVCGTDKNKVSNEIMKFIEDHKVTDPKENKDLMKHDIIRLICLFALKYETEKVFIDAIKVILKTKYGIESTLIDKYITLGQKTLRSKSNELFSKNMLDTINDIVKNEQRSVHQQFVPYVSKIYNQLSMNMLSKEDYPYISEPKTCLLYTSPSPRD